MGSPPLYFCVQYSTKCGFGKGKRFIEKQKLYGIKHKIKNLGAIDLTIIGDSMSPLIKNGDRVRIVKTYHLSVGKVVLFYTEGLFGKIDYIVHRIVKIEREKIWTKGDNNTQADEYICEDNILGEFESVV